MSKRSTYFFLALDVPFFFWRGMQFLLGKGIVTCCPCPKYWWVGEAIICASRYIQMFGMDKGLGVFKVVFEVERLIGVDEWWMSNTWMRSISLTSQMFIYPLVSTPIFLHGKNLFWWHSLLQKRFNLLMSAEVLFDSFKCFLLQESPLHVHHLVKVLETLQSLLFACSGLLHAHVCASEDPSGAPKWWRWWKVVKQFSYRNRQIYSETTLPKKVENSIEFMYFGVKSNQKAMVKC